MARSRREPRGPTNQQEFTEAARISWNTTNSLVCFSLQSHGKRRSAKKARRTNAKACQQRPASVKPSDGQQLQGCSLPVGLSFYSFQTSCVSQSSLQQNITCPFTKQLPENNRMSVLSNIPSSHLYFSKTSSHETASIKHHMTLLGLQ